MSLQWISSRYFIVSTGLLSSFIYLVILRLLTSSGLGGSPLLLGNGLFGVDFLGISFSVLSILLLIALTPVLFSGNTFSSSLLCLSVLFSLLSYISLHSLLFWGFYELSILFLLLLLIKDSPYSERYIAGWYLLGYVVFTSLPMFLVILWISVEAGSYSLIDWQSVYFSNSSVFLLVILSVLFITKIPLFPFHVWLPIVHAEAPSPVSVCLSGYIMKLGVLGLYRFCYSVLPDYIFSPFYSFIIIGLTILFFLSSCRELDGKRWLAFLSLAHISFVCLCLCLCDYQGVNLPFYFCLGHGLSAGVTFIILWHLYNLSSSRNWGVLKSSIIGSTAMLILSILCLFSSASVPPTITFFSEVLFLNSLLQNSVLLSALYFAYLFAGGLVPLFLLGFVLGRGYTVSLKAYSSWHFFTSIFFTCLFIYLLFVVF